MKLVLDISDILMKALREEYDEYCDIMEVKDESFEQFISTKLYLHMFPNNKEQDKELEYKILGIIEKNHGISPKELNDKLEEAN